MVDTKVVYPIIAAGILLAAIWAILYNFTPIEFTNLYGGFIAIGGLAVILGIIFYRQRDIVLQK